MWKNKTPYIIAEIGCNHNGDLDLARKMIHEAEKCGCDAVKFQLWTKDMLFTDNYLQELNDGKVRLENVSKWETKELGLNNIFDQVERFSIYKKEHEALFACARKAKIGYSSSVFRKEDVDFLIDQKVSFLKIASMDINNFELIDYVLSRNYRTVISTGLATLGEIDMVAQRVPSKARKNVALLHCVSLYPPRDAMVNLKFIQTLSAVYGFTIGYSDHTLGYSIPLAAAALGARVIEKHFTLDKKLPGWDHHVSADPQEMQIICRETKRISAALGDGRKVLSDEEKEKQLKFRRSLVTTREIKKGEKFTAKHFTFKRPGTGIPPHEVNYVIGRQAARKLEGNRTVTWRDIQ